MKILIIHNRYSRTGGEEKVVEMQRKLLFDAGHMVYTYIRDYHEMGKWKFGKIQSLFTAMYSRRAVMDIEKIARDFHPEVAIIHNLFPIISAAIIPKLKEMGIPVAMTVHNYRLLCPIGLFFNKGSICTRCAESVLRELNCTLRKCEGSICGSMAYTLRGLWSRKKGYFNEIDIFLSVSNFQKRNLVRYGIDENRIRVIPNCVKCHEHVTVKDDYIAFVGRLSPEKGINLLFEIASRLPEIHFKVAGDKAPNFTLPKAGSNIEMVGFLKGKELDNFYSHATALIFTSSVWEAMPLSPLEAMASKTAVISSNVSSIPEILDNGKAGIIFNSADEAVEKIRELVSNPDLRIKYEEEGYNRVKTVYSQMLYLESLTKALLEIRS